MAACSADSNFPDALLYNLKHLGRLNLSLKKEVLSNEAVYLNTLLSDMCNMPSSLVIFLGHMLCILLINICVHSLHFVLLLYATKQSDQYN